MINKERMLAEFIELVEMKCSTRAEQEVADVLKKRLEALGMEISEDGVGCKIGGNCGNLFAYRKGSVSGAPVLMLGAHLDCVEPCAGVKAQIKDGVITSDGKTILGEDDKAGVEAIMEALRVIVETGHSAW